MNSNTAYQCSDCGKVMAQDMTHRCVSTAGSNPAEMKPGTCTVGEEVADQLRVEPATVYNWIREGKLRGYRVGGYLWRIATDDYDRFVAEAANIAGAADDNADLR